MADLTVAVAQSHAEAPHQTGYSRRQRRLHLIAQKYDPQQPRDAEGQWTKGSGGVEHWVGGGVPTEPVVARTFTSEEGYQWHEQGPVADWARALPYADHQALGSYSGFGYHDTNDFRRGTYTPPIVAHFVRAATEAEDEAAKVMVTAEYLKAHPHPFGRNPNQRLPSEPFGRVLDEHGNYVGHIERNQFYTNPETGEKVFLSVQRAGPDLKRLAEVAASADRLDAVIRDHGYVLPEAITVQRGAYIPGLSFEQLQDMQYEGPNGEPPAIWEEKGFTSTFVGDAAGRAKSYPMLGKSESLYNRFHDTMLAHQNEVGSAIRFHITLPAGTKVASVEASRRLEHDFPRVPDPSPRPPDIEPEYWTMRDYTATPTVRDTNLTDTATRSESELLLGSGARFRVTKVQHGETYPAGGGMKAVPIVEVHLEYIGGGSSEGHKRAYAGILKYEPDQPRDTHGRFAEVKGPPATVMARLYQPDGGFTYSPTTGGQPRTGFAVSPHRRREQMLDLETMSEDEVADALSEFAAQNWDLLRKTGHYIGGWHHPKTGKVYLDISVVKKTAGEARQLALDSDQIAYFDLRRGKSVKLGRRQE